MTVDVEDYFQVSALAPHIDRASWESRPCRVEHNVDRILQVFADNGIQATFFTLGWLAQRYPDLVHRIVAAGHELASHGWQHVRVVEQSPREFRNDVSRTKALLEDLTGQQVRGYRAASFSITRSTPWAFDILQQVGYRYSSSIVPVRHDLYGMPGAPRFPFRPGAGALIEIPVTTVAVGQIHLPCAGGGWFRLLPYSVSRWALRWVNGKEHHPAVFYFHPWEIDPDQPRLGGLPLKTRFRHYHNLERTEARLQRLCDDFSWSTMAAVFLDREQPVPLYPLATKIAEPLR